MLKFWLATQVIEGKISLGEAEVIVKEMGIKRIPDTVEEIVAQLQKHLTHQ